MQCSCMLVWLLLFIIISSSPSSLVVFSYPRRIWAGDGVWVRWWLWNCSASGRASSYPCGGSCRLHPQAPGERGVSQLACVHPVPSEHAAQPRAVRGLKEAQGSFSSSGSLLLQSLSVMELTEASAQNGVFVCYIYFDSTKGPKSISKKELPFISSAQCE